MTYFPARTGLFAMLVLSGCATTPMGPTAMVMPAPGKPFDVFASDQSMCKQFADGEVAGGATLSNLKQLGTVAVSTALGGGLGEAIHRTRGAEIGGAAGALAGTAAAARGSAFDQNSLQGRYDLAYTQCMYARGNQIASAAPPAARLARATSGGYPQPASPIGPGVGPGSNPMRPDQIAGFNPLQGQGIH